MTELEECCPLVMELGLQLQDGSELDEQTVEQDEEQGEMQVWRM